MGWDVYDVLADLREDQYSPSMLLLAVLIYGERMGEFLSPLTAVWSLIKFEISGISLFKLLNYSSQITDED